MGVNEQRMEVLRRVERGDLSAEEGAILLGALDRGQQLPSFEPESFVNVGAVENNRMGEVPAGGEENVLPEQGEVIEQGFLTEKQIRRRKLVWVIPFVMGLLITALGGTWMVRGYQKAGLGWGFWLSWIPFALGILIMALSWNMSRGFWLHMRINQKPGRKPAKIDLSFPLPVKTAAWFLRTFGDRISGLRDKHLDGILEVLESGITRETPMIVQVDENDEKVDIWIERS